MSPCGENQRLIDVLEKLKNTLHYIDSTDDVKTEQKNSSLISTYFGKLETNLSYQQEVFYHKNFLVKEVNGKLPTKIRFRKMKGANSS